MKVKLLLVFIFLNAAIYAQSPFITSWQTTTSETSITIPTNPNYTYNYDIDWENDGTWDIIGATGDASHDYGSAGNYQVAIRGNFPAIYFNNGSEKDKIIDIVQWGDIVWQTMESAFYGCNNLTVLTDNSSPNLSQVTTMEGMFAYCINFNSDISGWNTSAVTDMNYMFADAINFNIDISGWDTSSVTNMRGIFSYAANFNQDISNWDVSNVEIMEFMFLAATNFDQDLSSWQVSNVTNMRQMFFSISISTVNYDALLTSWAGQSLQSGVQFGAGNSKYCSAAAANARQSIIDTFGWSIDDGGLCIENQNPFVLRVQVSDAADTYFTIPTDTNYSYNYDVDFNNDGSWDVTGVTGAYDILFPTTGTYDFAIRGDFPKIDFWNTNYPADRSKIIDIMQWGDIAWENFYASFFQCDNLTSTATDSPNLSQVTDLGAMFYQCSNYNSDISNWDVSSISSMGLMFSFTGLSTTNYDALLASWGAQNLQSGVEFDAGNSIYCTESAQLGRQTMIDTYGWTITDGGFDTGCTVLSAEEFIQDSSELKLFPNPATNYLKITSDIAIQKVKVLDLKGSIVLDLMDQETLLDVTIPVVSLPSGMYIVSIYTDQGISQKKFIKQ